MKESHKRVYLVILLGLLAITLRSIPLLLYGNFFDEQTMTAVLSIRQAIPSGHPVADALAYPPAFFAERGQVWLGLAGFWIFGEVAGGLLGSLHLMQILCTVAAGATVFFFAERLQKGAGPPAMLLYAVSAIGLYNFAINHWKGEDFCVTALLLSLLLLAITFDERRLSRKAASISGSLLALAFAVLVWNGGLFAAVVYAAAILSLQLPQSRISILMLFIAAMGGFIALPYFHLPLDTSNSSALLASSMPHIATAALHFLTETQINLFQGNRFWTSSPLYIPELLSGFMLFTFPLFFYRARLSRSMMVLLAFLACALPFILVSQSWAVLGYLPICCIAAPSTARLPRPALLTIVIISYVILTLMQLIVPFTILLTPLHRPYLNAVEWINASTPHGAIFLTWPSYCLPIEYYAGRRCVIDTNIADSPSAIANLSSFLLTQEGNLSYLARMPRGSYLLISTLWYTNATPAAWIGASPDPARTTLAALEAGRPVSGGDLRLLPVYDGNTVIIYRIID